MKNNARWMSALLALLMMVSMLAVAQAASAAEAPGYWDMLSTVSDSSELPDWTGKKVTLRFWYSHGNAWGNVPILDPDDVVIKEIERVTGIQIDVDNSFDNNGVAFSAKLPMIVASGDYPDIVYNGQAANLKDLIEADKLYDLTDLFDQYCPEFVGKLPRDKFASFYEANHMFNGRQYTLPSGVSDGDFYKSSPETFSYLDWERYKTNILSIFTMGNINGNNAIYVRDDILKALYPESHTLAELSEIYQQTGTFTREEIFDVPLKSADDFIKFLYDVQKYIADNGMKAENGRPLDVTYGPAVGADNWGWMKIMPQNIDGVVGETNYFTQFNKQSGKLELAYKMDYFVDYMKKTSQLVRDNVIAKDSLVDNAATFDEKINNAGYAVIYMKQNPNSILEAAGKTYGYRPLWVGQTYRNDQQAPFLQAPIGQAFGIFKDSVAEEDLPQVLRFFNYLYSDIGAKMMSWGPASAGLFEETNGTRTYKDETLYECMANYVDNKMNCKYGLLVAEGLGNLPFSVLPMGLTFRSNSPKFTYDVPKTASGVFKYHSPGILPGESIRDVAINVPRYPNIYNYQNESPAIKQFWAAREGFEKQMIKVIASESDAQFSAQYDLLLQYAEANGLTDAALAELNEIYLRVNGDALREAGLIQ